MDWKNDPRILLTRYPMRNVRCNIDPGGSSARYYEELKEKRKKENSGIVQNESKPKTPLSSLLKTLKEDGIDPEPPKQNTDEIGHKRYYITEAQQRANVAVVSYARASLEASKSSIMWNYAKTTMTEKNPIIEVTSDGYFKIVGGLIEDEYSALVGSRNWSALKDKYDHEKYLVYDDEQEKDPVTQLYPEFYLWFRQGCYVKLSTETVDDDPNPQLSFEFLNKTDYDAKHK